MGKSLVIVESPAKAKTIEKYLGKDYRVLASYGHVRDLVPKEGAVDPEHDFAMRYEIIDRNDFDIRATRFNNGAQHIAADTTKSVNCDTNCHSSLLKRSRRPYGRHFKFKVYA